MRRILLGLLVVAGCASNSTQDVSKPSSDSSMSAAEWYAELGKHHHPVSTKNALAQRSFDDGLILVYAFNHDEAVRSFKRAAEIDPELAMAHWGIALALGSNYNMEVTPENEKQAYEAIQRAIQLSRNATQPENDYINALSVRYSNEAKPDLKALDRAYVDAMKKLSQKYPDDLDAATLYADSMMILRPWKLWSKDGKPAEGTEDIVVMLESVLKRDPDHLGANHLYIHAIEASNHPERALPSADRLPGLSPSNGHLVHMPSHIYLRVGDFEAASSSNVAAIEIDEEYFRALSPPTGMYAMMYYPHNIHFLSYSRCVEGRSSEAREAAAKLVKYIEPHVAHMPPLEGFLPTTDMVLVRFGKWDDILRSPEPSRSFATTHALWRFSRAMAMVAKGNLPMAKREYEQFVAEKKAIPGDAPYSMLNSAQQVLNIADKVLQARIALANNQTAQAISLLEEAIKLEDELTYMEPPDWFMPCREMLGGVYLRSGRAAAAERVFRQDLRYNARSGRSLYGLMESLKAQGKTWDAQLVEPQFKTAWKNADVTLTINDL